MMHTAGSKKSQIQFIKQKAREIRIDIVKMTAKAGSGHPGGSLSSADIVAALYFGDVLRVKHDEPDWPDRDRFVLSKGHAAPVLYSALARRGFFPEEWLDTLRQLGSPLQGHPDCKRVPGVEVSTGSLGQGLSMAVGMALAGKWIERITMCGYSWVTGNARKARSGKPPWLQATTNSTTS